MKDYLNLRVKFREEFRPFAPAVLYSHLEDYFEIRQESPHMLIACGATDVAKEKIPATVHSDNSCRVQSVRPENNSRFFALLTAFYKKTQCPVLLNTSFNVKGQPIVNTPLQAIDCYLSTNIDCLVVGDYFIEKN
jgi:carbamoyltransferase